MSSTGELINQLYQKLSLQTDLSDLCDIAFKILVLDFSQLPRLKSAFLSIKKQITVFDINTFLLRSINPVFAMAKLEVLAILFLDSSFGLKFDKAQNAIDPNISHDIRFRLLHYEAVIKLTSNNRSLPQITLRYVEQLQPSLESISALIHARINFLYNKVATADIDRFIYETLVNFAANYSCQEICDHLNEILSSLDHRDIDVCILDIYYQYAIDSGWSEEDIESFISYWKNYTGKAAQKINLWAAIALNK